MIVATATADIDRPFRFVVASRPNHEIVAVLSQGTRRGAETVFEQVVAVWGLPLEVAKGAVADALRANGVSVFRGARLPRPGEADILLDEATGIRLSLVFLALKPLRRLDRMEEIVEKIRDMSREETFYWFSKCINGHGQRATKALRVLLSEEG